MRVSTICIAVLALLLLPRLASADATATTRPSMMVAVLPFDVLGDAGQVWIGRAIQEGIANGIQGHNQLRSVIVPAVGPIDDALALSDAKSAGANLVILGSVQVMDDQMRVSGRILAVDDGHLVGNLKMDNGVKSLFDAEDVLAERAVNLLAPVSETRPASTGPRPELELVGPTIGQPPKCFDGDLSRELKPPQRFSYEYDKYNLRPSDCYWSYCGYSCWGWGCGWSCGSRLAAPAVPLSTW